jgi:hypothetical protein
MADRKKLFFLIPTDKLSELGREFGNIDRARALLEAGQTLVQAIASKETVLVEYRIRESPAEKTTTADAGEPEVQP